VKKVEPAKKAMEYLLGGLAFHTNISSRIGAIADLDDCKTRLKSRISLLYFYDLVLDLFSNRSKSVKLTFVCSRTRHTFQLRFHLLPGLPLLKLRYEINEAKQAKTLTLKRAKKVTKTKVKWFECQRMSGFSEGDYQI
jgi:hypothetical protein